ncbi:preprotein translocase subunit yidC, partial [Thauera linaloolentis 47Lol = DSM 12138]
MDQRRLILFLVFSFSLVMLWEGWIKHNNPAPAAQETSAAAGAAAADGSVPTPSA